MKYSISTIAAIYLPVSSMRREWIEIFPDRPGAAPSESPSMRREWIEMCYNIKRREVIAVSLHAEGVD